MIRLSSGLLVLLAPAFLMGCMAAGGDVPRPRELRSERVEALVVPRVLTGELAAEHALLLRVPDSRVRPLEIRFCIENGVSVEEGDLLFEFDNSQVAQNLEQRQVEVTQALTALATARSQAGTQIAQAHFALEQRKAEVEKARIDAEIPEGLKSDLEYERLQLELDRAGLRVEEANRALEAQKATSEAEVEIKRLELQKKNGALLRAESGIESLEVRAPRAGVALVAENRREDRMWQEGDSAFTGDGLARIPELESMVVRARLFDVDDGRIVEGQQATVTLDAFPETRFTARVRRVEPIAKRLRRGSTTRSFGVVVDLDRLDLERMRPGLSARVEIETRIEPAEGSGGLLVVPRESLLIRAEEPVLVLRADGRRVVVELGPCGPLRCVVVSDELDDEAALGRWADEEAS